MKDIKYIFRLFLFFLIAAGTLFSCRKDEEPDHNYFVSSSLLANYPEAYINTMLAYIAQSFPDLDDLEPFVGSGVSVFKLIYKTEINGEKISASGLISIPAIPGEYPVLSFQNGTNTLNDNCPTNNPEDNLYRLVEFIASMGFVVIIPDYPGFGESAGIPHPYLIKEPTIRSVKDMIRAVRESGDEDFPGIVVSDDVYLMGYSQGGWATLALHRSMELDDPGEFNIEGSVCGAGPYNMYNLFLGMVTTSTYSMPSYLGYIINAYHAYDQFTNDIPDILNEPYASDLISLYNGTLSLDQINSQLTTSIPGLLKSGFISGFTSSPDYSTVRESLLSNSVEAWNASNPILLVHGGADTHVSVTTSESIYDAMINAGTLTQIIEKSIYPGLDHGDAVVPAMVEGLLFLLDIKD